jgi:2-polyprenyl-3-methyl-5-hydroxy-6-metoxy-1,4-benzoquinol methylase
VLDVGCGEGRHTVEICHWDCRAVGVDLSRTDLKVAKLLLGYERRDQGIAGSGDFMAVDAQHLPFNDNAFDKIVCTEVLEHIPDDKAGIRELVRVLKPGGLIAVSVPNFWPEILFWTISWGYWHSPGGHIRFYRPGEMEAALQEGGLEIYARRLRHTIQAVYWFFRCAFGINNEDFVVTRNLQKAMQWHYRTRPRLLEYAEALVNPVFGKDLVFYGRKPTSPPG